MLRMSGGSCFLCGPRCPCARGCGIDPACHALRLLHPCRVSVSSSGRYIAAADGSGQVLLYGFLPYKGTFLKWDLVGKFRAHHSECCQHGRAVVWREHKYMLLL